MIVTFWPSSRRLAIMPPHESATSSGCGAMKTWVTAPRVYRAPFCRRRASRLEAARTDQRDEDAVAVRALEPVVAVALHDRQQLSLARPHGDHEPAALGELVAELVRDGRCRGGDDDAVPRCAGPVAKAPVGLPDLDRSLEWRRQRGDPLAGR